MRTPISRSLHTQHITERATRRLLRPHSARYAEAALLSGRETHFRPVTIAADTDAPVRLSGGPRITTHKPLPDLVLPLCPSDVRRFFAILGPASLYGLRRVRLRQQCLFTPQGVTFAEYTLGGAIDIYAVPPSPWRLAFVPCDSDLRAFTRHAARLDVETTARRTTVWWEPDGLLAFFLFEVLAHEIGHHVLQRDRGRQSTPACRRADHEACADTYARRVVSRLWTP